MNLILPLNILERLLLFLCNFCFKLYFNLKKKADDAMDNFVGRHKKE